MNASNTPADRAANPLAYRQFSLGNKLVVQLRNDLPRDEAIRALRSIAGRLEAMVELEVSESAF